MIKFLKGRYRDLKNILTYSRKKDTLVKFKKEIWQTNEISSSFISGSDGQSVVAADLMDKEVNEFFLSSCKKGDRVLDIGCGHGIVSVYLAQNGLSVTSVDISEKLLAELQRRIQNTDLNINVKRGDAYNIPCDADYFDVVVARMFLPHFPDWPKVLKEMARVTKSGGKLLVHFASKENTDLGKKIGLQDCRFASSPDISDPWAFYAEADNADLKRTAATAGLEVENRTPVSFFLHNRILGYQLGTEKYNQYMEQVQEYIKDEKVKAFALWFDKEIISQCSPYLSHFNIITFKKL